MIGHLKFKLEAIILLFGRLPRQSKQSNSSTRILNDKQRKVKMARYWPSFFFVLTSRWVNKRIYYMAKRLHQRIPLLQEQCGKSGAGKIGLSCPLG